MSGASNKEVLDKMGEIQSDLIARITTLSKSVEKSLTRTDEFKSDMQNFQNRMRYENICYQSYENSKNNNDVFKPFRSQELSMLTVKELIHLGKFKILGDHLLSSCGNCPFASGNALSFFSESHPLMNAKKIENAVMISCDNQPIKFQDNSINHESVKGEIFEGMGYFYWDNFSIWKRGNTTIVEDVGKKGQFHTVVLVHTADDEIVVVDWSFQQFCLNDLKNARLYHSDF